MAKEDIKSFLSAINMTESEVLNQVQFQKNISREFVRQKRNEFEIDEKLLNNQKANPDLIGDTTLFNVHTNLLARSFSDKINITFRGGTGEKQKTTTLQKMYNEDIDTPDMKMVKYQKDHDKFLYWVGIVARTWWDGVYKRNKFQVVNPKTWYPDLDGDYITGNYSYTGFDKLMYMDEMKNAGYKNLDDLAQSMTGDNGAKFQQEQTQQDLGYVNLLQNTTEYNGQYEIYIHFAIFNGVKGYVITGNNEQLLLGSWLVKAGNKQEKENPDLIKFPFVHYYWKPRRNDPMGFRVADYVRDVQINKSKIANLQLDKSKAELYPMYLFNADYVKGSDLGFWFNKFIPFKSGVDWPINPQNIVSPIVPNTRIDSTMTLTQSLDRQVEKSTSIWEVAQGTTTEWRETLGTNQLIQSNTDINLSLNTKLDNISEEYFVLEWLRGYYINFTSADSKIIYASEWFMDIPLHIKREDFYVEGNIKIDIETGSETEQRKNKQRLAFNQTVPMILQDPSVPSVSKRRALRRVWEINGVDQWQIDEELPKLPDEVLQEQENALLSQGIPVDINPEDDDLVHLVCVEAVTNTIEWEMHKQAHLLQYISKGKPQPQEQQNGMMNSLASQSMAQFGAQSTQANAQPQATTAA